MASHFKVVAGNSNRPLAEAICNHLSIPLAKAASDSMDAIAGFLVTAPGVETLTVNDKPAKPAKPGTRVAATDDKKKS